MLQAAHLAGRAINVSYTTAPHAMSYVLTRQHGIPHGLAVAVSIAAFLRFNALVTAADVADPRGLTHVQAALQRIAAAFQDHSREPAAPPRKDQRLEALTAALERAASQWEQLLVRAAGGRQLSHWGITSSPQREEIITGVNLLRLQNNPRRVTKNDLRKIVELMA